MIRRMKLQIRSAVFFGILGTITVLQCLISYNELTSLNNELHVITSERMPAYTSVGEIRHEYDSILLVTAKINATSSQTEIDTALAQLTALKKAFQQSIADLESHIHDATALTELKQLRTDVNKYEHLQESLLSLYREGRHDEAETLRTQGFEKLGGEIAVLIRELEQFLEDKVHESTANAEQTYSLSLLVQLATGVIAISAVITLAILFSRSIILPLKEAVATANSIASGDLTANITPSGKDEVTELMQAMQEMQSSLTQTISSIASSSGSLSATSEELSAISQQATQNMSSQREQLELASTSVTELTAAIEEVARNADSTSKGSSEANDNAQAGLQKVQETITRVESLVNELQTTSNNVESLAEKVTQVSSVLDVIRGIAEQTNLLALNAAIEAARAGETGRGFAVVADEVRALAHRTQESTQEVEGIINSALAEASETVSTMKSSNQSVVSSLDIASEAGEALNKIALTVGGITEQNLTIASAAEEQATAAKEVDQNIIHISELTNQAAEGVNYTNDSVTELARLAEELNKMVLQFKV